MSLLLDALNRASKDKAAAAASPPKLDAPTVGLPVLTDDVTAVAPPVDQAVVLELTLANDAVAPTPVDAWHTEPSVASPARSLLEPDATTEPRPTTKPPSPPPPSMVDSPSSPGKPVHNATRVAQEIVRAKAEASRTGGPPIRLIVLASLAVLLAAALGSMLLGGWGDPSAWLRPGAMSRPVAVTPTDAARVAPVAVAQPEPEPSVAAAGAVPVAPIRATPPKPLTAPPVPGALAQPPRPLADTPRPASQAPARPGPAAVPSNAGQAMIQSRTVGPSTLELGYAALIQGRLPAAQAAYGQALLANSEERDALLGLAYIAHQQGRLEEARGYYQRVLRQDPGNPIARSGLLVANPVDDPQAVASRSREVAEQNPDSAAAQAMLGHAMVRDGRLADAQQAFFRAHSLEPNVAQHAFNLAVALDRLRNFGPARQYYERALTLSAQSGGERASGVPQSVVQTRLDQLRAATLPNPVGAARE